MADLDAIVRDLEGYYTLPLKDFDVIVGRHGVDPDDDALVDRLVALGWMFSCVDDLYIAPPKPKDWYDIGWYSIIKEGGLNL